MNDFYSLVNGRLEPAPTSLMIDGRRVSNPPADEYPPHGYYPLAVEPPSPPPGSHLVRRVYRVEDGRIVASYDYAPDPPRDLELSKRRLMNNLKAAPGPGGTTMWDVVRKWMEDTGRWDDWLMSTTLMERDPMMQEAIAALPALGFTPERIEELLVSSEAYG